MINVRLIRNALGGTGNSTTGFEVWRSSDGLAWRRADEGGPWASNNYAAARMEIHNGDLYMGTVNWIDGCEVWRFRPMIFSDGFESSTTSAWSVTVP